MWRMVWKWLPAAALICGMLTVSAWMQSAYRTGRVVHAITYRDDIGSLPESSQSLNRLSRATGIRGSYGNVRMDPVTPLESVQTREELAQHVNALLTKNNPELGDTDRQRILDLAERLDPGNGFYAYAVACIRLTDLSQQLRFREQAERLPPELKQGSRDDRKTLRGRQRLFWTRHTAARMSPRQREERDRCMRMLVDAASARHFRSYRWEPANRLAQAVNTGSVYQDTLAYRLATHGWDQVFIHRPPFSLAEWFIAWWSDLPEAMQHNTDARTVVRLESRLIQDASTIWDILLARHEARSAQNLVDLVSGTSTEPATHRPDAVPRDAGDCLVAGPLGGLTEVPWHTTTAISAQQRRQAQWMENLELESYTLLMLLFWLMVRTGVWIAGVVTRSLPPPALSRGQRVRVFWLIGVLLCAYGAATRVPGIGLLWQTPADSSMFNAVQVVIDSAIWLIPGSALLLVLMLRWVFPVGAGLRWEPTHRWFSWFCTALLGVAEASLAAAIIVQAAWNVAGGRVQDAAIGLATMLLTVCVATHQYRLASAKARGIAVRPLSAYASASVWAMLLCVCCVGFWLNRWQHNRAVRVDVLLTSPLATRSYVSPAETLVVQAMRDDVLGQWPFTARDPREKQP